MNEKYIKNNKGITIIALVVMVIIILILASVSIGMFTGESSILKLAKETKKDYENAKDEEIYESDEISENVANAPILKNGMIPVTWNGKEWTKADINNTNKTWYEYNKYSRRWANAVTVKENGTKTRKSYETAPVNTKIAEEDITTMFVWIPRYAYLVESGYHTNADPEKNETIGQFSIKWLKDDTDKISGTNEFANRNSSTNRNYVVHPAFTNDTNLGGMDKEIKGFWMGKFETSNENSKIDNENMTTENEIYGRGNNSTNDSARIIPNVSSWRGITAKDSFIVSQNMKEPGNIHGLTKGSSEKDADTMLIKNSQWGAVAYLAQSEYGNRQTNKENSGIWNNAYSEGEKGNFGEYEFKNMNLTGMSGQERESTTGLKARQRYKRIENKEDRIIINYEHIFSGYAGERVFYRYNSENGQKSSTTRNIYGIYDMAASSWEYMASYVDSNTRNTESFQFFKSHKGKYATEYKNNKTSNEILPTPTANVYGDAIWETSNIQEGKSNAWNNDFSFFPDEGMIFLKGGYYDNASMSGVFTNGRSDGEAEIYYGFRTVII